MDLTNLSSNWKKLKSTQPTNQVTILKPQNGMKRKLGADVSGSKSKKRSSTAFSRMSKPLGNVNQGLDPNVEIGKYVALDCEMVGVGPMGTASALARVSIVNYDGAQVYDSYVKPKEQVTDWRTPYSGIARKHMNEARSFETAQDDVVNILQGKILIGHSLRNDLDVLMLSHPKRDIRDTARHPPYRKLAGGGSPKLKILASELLGIDIQVAAEGHSSVEDARACMLLFRKDKDVFEKEHAKNWPRLVSERTSNAEEAGSKQGKKKKKKKK